MVSTDLIEKHCPVCCIHYAAPRAMFDMRNADEGPWYCPNGHRLVFTESAFSKAKTERDQLRRERDQLKQNEAYLEQTLADTARERTALKGQVTKLHKRIGAGVCPCCTRSFTDLKRHMASKHAGFREDAQSPPLTRKITSLKEVRP
jgi:predicted  nucleic acid-binding Zn-ribbon protein